MKTRGALFLVAYISTIFLANWLVHHYGVVPVGFGLVAPAGVYAVGLAFTLRDLTQTCLGVWAVVAAIVVGAGLSFLVSPTLAVASAAAFLFSELADLSVYTPLEKRGWLPAVVASNTVGLVVDSILFLWLAFGSFDYLAGQVVGKAWMTLAAIPVLWAARRALLPRHA